MAKENTVLLYGYPEKSPRFHTNDDGIVDYIRMELVTVRKTFSNNLVLGGPERSNSITVFIRNRELIDKMCIYRDEHCTSPSSYNLGTTDPLTKTMFLIRGTLSTKYITKRFQCSACGMAYSEDFFFTYVDPVNLHFWEFDNADPTHCIRDKNELSNLVLIWGTLCREPTLYPDLATIMNSEEKLPKIECEFQIASNRKRHILEDTPLDTTDYPWVKVFGQKAVDAAQTLSVGSEIYIHGSLESRIVDNSHVCPHCGHTRISHDKVMEIVPYQIMQESSENTAFLYGKILEQNPKVSLKK